MIKYFHGDSVNIPSEIHVNTVNCVGVMGAGVAKAFKAKHPDMFAEYKKECDQGLYHPGQPRVWIKDGFEVINFPTKKDWRNPSQYEWIAQGLQWLREYLLKRPGCYIALPALGCGHGGLSWPIVNALIQHYLWDVECHIMVHHPFGWPSMKGYVTGVGSQSTPEDIQAIMTRMGRAFAQRGWCMRSGAAKGADNAFQVGVESVVGDHPAYSEIYVCAPSKMRRGAQNYYLGQDLASWEQAQELASTLHPAWQMMKGRFEQGQEKYGFFMDLHTRNCFQVLGASLNLPSKVLYCWAPPQGTPPGVSGGTNTSIQLAYRFHIPIVNLYHDDVRARVLTWLEEHEQKVNV